jgi:hypothetical protein
MLVFKAFETAFVVAEAQHVPVFLSLLTGMKLAIYDPYLYVGYYSLCLDLLKCMKREVILPQSSRPLMAQDSWTKIWEKVSTEEVEMTVCGGLIHLRVQHHTGKHTLVFSIPYPMLTQDSQGQEIRSRYNTNISTECGS